MIRSINAGSLSIAYLEEGEPGGWPVVLLHGFPYDIHAYTDVSKILAAAGARVIVPYLRGSARPVGLPASSNRLADADADVRRSACRKMGLHY